MAESTWALESELVGFESWLYITFHFKSHWLPMACSSVAEQLVLCLWLLLFFYKICPSSILPKVLMISLQYQTFSYFTKVLCSPLVLSSLFLLSSSPLYNMSLSPAFNQVSLQQGLELNNLLLYINHTVPWAYFKYLAGNFQAVV